MRPTLDVLLRTDVERDPQDKEQFRDPRLNRIPGGALPPVLSLADRTFVACETRLDTGFGTSPRFGLVAWYGYDNGGVPYAVTLPTKTTAPAR